MPPICITLGDPAGIGPEVTFKALETCHEHPGILLFGHPDTIYNASHSLQIQPNTDTIQPNAIHAMPIKPTHEPNHNHNDPTNAAIAHASLIQALDYCKKHACPLVTAPISKAGFSAANIPFTDHTTLLQHYFKCPNASMAFYSEPLKVVLATIHIPLNQVEASLTPNSIRSSIQNAHAFAQTLKLSNPTIAIAGLNPHAGEQGQFGTFETNTLRPIIASTRLSSGQLIGPISPDTVFRNATENKADIVIAMYHDQGLIPVKLLAFDTAVNVTLGLPICRTSPDHGTAYDIAHKNIANPSAMAAAINYAITYGQ